MASLHPSNPSSTLSPAGIASFDEKRRELRTPAQGEATIRRDGTFLFEGRVLNISPSGCFIQTREPIGLGPCSQVEIDLSVSNRLVRVAAETRFISPTAGIGFRFLEADRAVQSILDGLLAGFRPPQAEDPARTTPTHPSPQPH
jgi:hypothetical protein